MKMSLRPSTSMPRACSGPTVVISRLPIVPMPPFPWSSLIDEVPPNFQEVFPRMGFNQLGNSEVEDFDDSIGANNHVLRFDIAVNDSGIVCGAKAPAI